MVGFAEAITRRPWVVVVVWVIVAALAFPLFINLHKVVKEEMYTLPSSSESMKAMSLMKRVSAGKETHTGLIIVDRVNLEDNATLLKLAKIGVELNKSVVGRYASKINALPVILAETNKTIYYQVFKALNQTASGAAKLYATLEQLDKAYAAALANASKQVRQLNQSLRGVMEADKGYVEAYKGLVSLRNALNKTMDAVITLDKAYVEATNKVQGLATNITRVARALQAMDKAYSGLYQNISSAAKRLVALYSNESLVSSIEQGLGYTWWQVTRAYYYLDKLGGNYTAYAEIANLSKVSPELAPLPRKEALEAWQLVKRLVSSGKDPDEAALVVAAKMFSEKAPAGAKPVLLVAGQAWNQSLAAYKASHNISCLTCLYALGNNTIKSQLTVLGIARNISKQAAQIVVSRAKEEAATLLATMLSSKNIPKQLAEELALEAVEGRLDAAKVARLVAQMAAEKQGIPTNMSMALAGLLVKHDPWANYTLATSWAKAVKAAGEFFEEMGAPKSLVEKLVELLSENPRPARKELAEIALGLVAEKAGREAKPVLEAVAAADPNAEGRIATNKTLAAELAADTVYRAATQRGQKLDKALVEKLALMLAEGDAKDTDLRKLALSIVSEKIREEKGEEAAKTIVLLLSRFDPEAKGVLASNETQAIEALYWLAEKQGHRIPFAPEQLAMVLHNPSALRQLVARMFVNMSAEKAPEKMRPLVEKLAEMVVEKGPGIPAEEKWNIVEQLLAEQAKKMKPHGANIPPQIEKEILSLAIRVARHQASLEQAAEKLANEVLLGSVAPRIISEAKGLMVSKDLRAFSIIVVPLGETQEERAKSIEAAANVTAKLLSKHGISAEIYVSGEDIVLQQVRQYAIKDAEKTSKLSELGTFIVLLVLLESFFAVFLPYIGIILGLAVGGAIVYIAASHGLIDFSSHTQSVMITTALGLGADYAGYLIYRFKEEYALTGNAREAARRSLKRAGPAIVASATTVVIGFGSLLLAWDISFLRGFGEAIPIAVAATATASLTLVPALLALVGDKRWFWWPRRPRREKVIKRRSRVMESLLRHEKVVLGAMLALIIVSGYFYATFHGTHDMKLMLPEKAPALKAFHVMSAKFEAGITDPVFVVVETKKSIWSSPVEWKLVTGLVDEIAKVKGVATVMAPMRPMGRPVANITLAEEMGGKAFTSPDGRTVLIQVILGIDPYSKDGEKAIREIHRVAHAYAESHGLRVYVDGSPYATLEMDDILTSEFYHRVLPGAAILMILAFTLIFGGFWVSVAALIVIIGAAMTGIMASILLFKYVFGKQMLWFMHIITLAAVMGVGMDYNSFFLARALEECHKTGCKPKESVIRASGAVSLFIIGLSLVVTTAYAMLMTASNTGMREMGFALATTVFTAALMASYLLTPIVVSILGRHAWWPWGLKKKIEH